MKELQNCFLILLFALLINHQTLAQQVVTYDFETNAFDKTIPFDELFTFKFINIPKVEADSFVFTCWRINKQNDPMEPLFEKHISISTIVGDTVISFVSPNYFPPNKDFVFQVNLLAQRELTENEEEELLAQITGSEIISKNLDKLYAFIRQNDFEEQSQENNIIFSRIKYLVDSLAKTMYGKQIRISYEKDVFVSQLKMFSKLSSSLIKLSDAIDYLKRNLYYLNDTTGVYRRTLNELEKGIQGITFFPFANFELVQEIVVNITDDEMRLTFEDVITSWKELDEFRRLHTDVFMEILIADALINQMSIVEFAAQTYPKGLVEQSKNYIAADLGYIYIPALDRFAYIATASIYFRPVKRSVPLGMYKGFDVFKTRFSIDVGLTLNAIDVKNEIKGFQNTNKGLILGGGFRILPFLKMNTGTVVYMAKDKNPLINNYSYKWSWYIGASIDLSVSALFKENFSGAPAPN